MEDRHRTIQDKKDRVKNALASNKLLDTDVKRDALELAKSGAWDDAGPDLALAMGGSGGGTLANSQDDEYRSVVIFTTSHSNSQFVLTISSVLLSRRNNKL